MKITSLLSDKPYSAIAIAVCFAVMLILPWFHVLPQDSALHLSAYWVTLIGKIMCLALVALALDLVWGKRPVSYEMAFKCTPYKTGGSNQFVLLKVGAAYPKIPLPSCAPM